MLHGFLQVIGGIGILFLAFTAFNLNVIPQLVSRTVPVTAPVIDTDSPASLAPPTASSSMAQPHTKDAISTESNNSTVVAASHTPEPVSNISNPQKEAETPISTAEEAESNEPIALRITNPYDFSKKSTEALNIASRAALVNIFCTSSGGSLNPISGSGVLISPNGVILTNAHVAQYVLLASKKEFGLSCAARNGSPAKHQWTISPLYIPDAWVREHAPDIRAARPMGTGEHDYALLAITGSINGSSLSTPLPYLHPDTREAIGFVDDTVMLAAYPAEFSGGLTTQNDLYAASAVSTIRELYTFTDKPVDLISLGSAILAQSGSSGGAVVNEWGQLIGIITTTSEGKTTGERDLRAVTLSYINRAISRGTGQTLSELALGDPISKSIRFMSQDAPALIQLYVDALN